MGHREKGKTWFAFGACRTPQGRIRRGARGGGEGEGAAMGVQSKTGSAKQNRHWKNNTGAQNKTRTAKQNRERTTIPACKTTPGVQNKPRASRRPRPPLHNPQRRAGGGRPPAARAGNCSGAGSGAGAAPRAARGGRWGRPGVLGGHGRGPGPRPLSDLHMGRARPLRGAEARPPKTPLATRGGRGWHGPPRVMLAPSPLEPPRQLLGLSVPSESGAGATWLSTRAVAPLLPAATDPTGLVLRKPGRVLMLSETLRESPRHGAAYEKALALAGARAPQRCCRGPQIP